MIFVANPVVSCFESAISMLLLGALQIQPWGHTGKGALKSKRQHKNKWFLNIIQTGINPTTPDLTGSTGFVTKNHKYFSPITSRICKCFIWPNSAFLRHPVHIFGFDQYLMKVVPAKLFCQLTSPWSSLGWLTPGTLTWIASVNFVGALFFIHFAHTV